MPEEKQHIVLGVTGSIAAYKAADLTSKLVQTGLDVHVMMTESACKLVQPQTFLTLSRNPVINDLWTVPSWQPEHIALSERAELLVVAPATANFLGKLARGIADDALSTYALSHRGKVIVAPAMNPRMWAHPAVQENCRILRERGVAFVDPEAGRVACGTDGVGRMAGVQKILRSVQLHTALNTVERPADPKKLRVLVTAGPTHEHLDPVRFLTNRSSGRMGYALAEAAAVMGHEVKLISGPCDLPEPSACELAKVESAAEMAEAVKEAFPDCDLLVMTAAVADLRPVNRAEQKLKKDGVQNAIEVEKTEDILGAVGKLKSADQHILGFAAETENLLENARKKLNHKNIDWIAVNDVSREEIGFQSSENEVVFVSKDCETTFPRCPKTVLAVQLLAEIEKQLAAS